jgi:hypothetical protein
MQGATLKRKQVTRNNSAKFSVSERRKLSTCDFKLKSFRNVIRSYCSAFQMQPSETRAWEQLANFNIDSLNRSIVCYSVDWPFCVYIKAHLWAPDAHKSGFTSAYTLASCQRKGGATLAHSWQSVTSYQTNQPVNRKLLPRAVEAHRWMAATDCSF